MADEWKPAAHLAATASVIYDEAVRLRANQESRIDDLRGRSLAAFSLITTGVAIATAVGSESLDTWAKWLVVPLISISVLCVGRIQLTRRSYVPGPDIAAYVQSEWGDQAGEAVTLRNMALEHWRIYAKNRDHVLVPMQHAFAGALVAAGGAVITIIAGVAA